MNDKIQHSGLFYQKYQIQSEIGRGASGVCYKVKKNSNSKVYALKKISSNSIKKNNIKGAYNQVMILSSLQHPNIIKYYESFMDEQQLYIIMQYASKGDLHTILKKRKIKQQYFQENQLWLMIHHLLNALQYLHNKNIIHRDVKTLNIFVDQNNNLIIGDLGVSKILKSDLGLYSRVGTPLYLPPQIIKYQKYDFKADVWGLGCVAYLLATLSHPFQGKNIISLGQNIVNTDPKPIQKYSNNLQSLIFDMLQKNHTKRLSTSMLIKKYYSGNQKIKLLLESNSTKKIQQKMEQVIIQKYKQQDSCKQENMRRSNKTSFQHRNFTAKKTQQPQLEEKIKSQKNQSQFKNSTNLRYQKKLTYLIGNFVNDDKIPINYQRNREKSNHQIPASTNKTFENTIAIKPKKLSQQQQEEFGYGNQEVTKCQKQSNNFSKKIFQSHHYVPYKNSLKQSKKQSSEKNIDVYHNLREKHSFSKIIANNIMKKSGEKLPLAIEKLTPTNNQSKKLFKKIKVANFSSVKSNNIIKSVQNFEPFLIKQDQEQNKKIYPSQIKKISTQVNCSNQFQKIRKQKQCSVMEMALKKCRPMIRNSHQVNMQLKIDVQFGQSGSTNPRQDENYRSEMGPKKLFIQNIKDLQKLQNAGIGRYRQRPKSSIGKKQKYYESSSIKPKRKENLYHNMYSMVQTKILKKPQVIIL